MRFLLFPFLTLFASVSSASLQAQATLRVDPVHEGGTATFHIDGGSPRAFIVICYSLSGTGPTTLPSSLILDLSNPIGQLNPFVLDTTGSGTLGPLRVPGSLSAGTQVWVQGVQVDFWSLPTLSTTNMVPVMVEQNPGTPPPPRPDTVLVQGGTFEMGDHFNMGNADENPIHSVSLDSFYMDQNEVSNKKFVDYLNSAYAQGTVIVSFGVVYQVGGAGLGLVDISSNGSKISWDGGTFAAFAGFEDHPVIRVSWHAGCHYANWLSREDNFAPCYNETTWVCDFAAEGYRLPTEAEWEYAARGGAHAPYYKYPWNSNGISQQDANWGNHVGNTTEVGNYSPNGYGLFDTAGNVMEWCNDKYEGNYYSNSSSSNPTGPNSGLNRVCRGGSWRGASNTQRSAGRDSMTPVSREAYLGFRLLAPRL